MRSQRPARQGCGCVALSVFLVLAAISAAVIWGQSGQSQSTLGAPTATTTSVPAPTEIPPTAAPSLAYQLAVIQAGVPLASDDPRVGQFAAALSHIAPKCQETMKNLSDFTVVTHDDMLKRGVDEPYLSILTHVDTSIPPSALGAGPIRCSEVFALYATLRIPR